ncbi:TauD/TfdA family dioxygenase [Streptomyces sp. NPDC048297]|uniref:TauD/TfdA family dioxygenase n=1 Tax=Streptomyces sp. NPDC048297 TaxID=3365531 RepID=UPI00371D3D45
MNDDSMVVNFDPADGFALLNYSTKIVNLLGSSCHPDIWAEVGNAIEMLPSSLSAKLDGITSGFEFTVLRGLPIDDADPGPTPRHWSQAGEAGAVWDVVLLMVAGLMGQPIAWEGQQDGRFVHNIVPSPGHENQQTGASSTALLNPHTEDGFHPGRAHLLLLACMRNPDRVPTTAASVRRVSLSERDVEILSRPVTPILPDDFYTEARPFQGEARPVPVLWSSQEGLMMRFDPSYTPLEQAPAEFRAAYTRLEEELARVSVDVSLEPGDVLIVQNDLVAHGRVPFRARFDGTDRWLKRALVRTVSRGSSRPPEEATEHGYGQTVLEAGLLRPRVRSPFLSN